MGTQPTSRWPRGAAIALVFAVGAALSAAACLGVHRIDQRRAVSEFRERAGRAAPALQQSVDLCSEDLRSVAHFFGASEMVDRSEFRAFVAPVLATRWSVRCLLWAPRVRGPERNALEQAGARQLATGYRVLEYGPDGEPRPAGAADAYYPVWYCQPTQSKYEVLGLDLGSLPAYAEAFDRATDTGQPQAVSAQGPSGSLRRNELLFVVPLYAAEMPSLADADLRRESLLGFAVSVVDLDRLADDALERLDLDGLWVQAFPANGPGSAGPAVSWPDGPGSVTPPVGENPWVMRSALRMLSEPWIVVCGVAPGQASQHRGWRAWVALAIGLAISLLAAAYVGQLSGRAEWARRLVDERTAELKDATARLRDEVSEHERKSEALQRSEERYRMLVESMSEGLTMVDTDGRLTYVNDAFCRMVGYERDELIGRKAFALLDKANQQILLIQLAIRRTGENAAYELDWTAKDGRPVSTIISPRGLPDPRGVYQGSFAVITDITQRKHMEAELQRSLGELRRSNSALEEFAYVASHDLQEPLRKVTAFGDRLQAKYGDALGTQGADYLQRMQAAARRMQTLINGLLTYSRVTTKAKPFEPVDLQRVTQTAVEDLEMRIRDSGGRVEFGQLPTIPGDALQIQQLLQNLIGNALKFAREGVPPVVTVNGEMDPADGTCRLTVSDNGIGIEEKFTERIFGVFQRLHGRGEYEGTGIGLAICRRIAERHGGTISVSSRPGEGSTFVVTLPTHHELQEEQA